jgi:uncharacterized Zn-binding protein involved in type VI secretion
MPPVTRLADVCTGHPRHPSRPVVTASSNVFVNGRGAVREGDLWSPHNHIGISIGGSGTVFVNGRRLCRQGDAIDCGSMVATGSSNVFAGG